jgi:S-DNA-T family DNA segregation ATPase FtsK/SpoIIIE
VVILDDAEQLKGAPIEQALSGISAGASFCVAVDTEAASSMFGGALPVARKARLGLVLSPLNAMAGTTLFGTQIPRYMLGAQTPGGAVLHRDGAWQAVRVPDVRQ